MAVRIYTKIYILLTGLALSAGAVTGVFAQASSPAEATRADLIATHGGLFRVGPARGYFDDRSDIPWVEQFMKRWDAGHRS